MSEYITRSRRETARLGKKLAGRIPKNRIVFFKGEMGAGKTAFIKGLCAGLGVKDTVTSPTFAIANRYDGESAAVYHFDMYRIESEDRLYNTGFYDCLDEGVIAVEWSENISAFFPERDVTVTIEKTGENTRKITVEGVRI